jgi:NAD(P)-dependent dehydrogenase (short-subunit alcohol dehydrogenase family)
MYLQKYDLKGRSALVTGGGRAIGLACVEALAEAGAKVFIADYDMKVAAEGQAEMKSKGHAVETVKMDVTNSAEVTKVANDLGRSHGGIDILVNNAGSMSGFIVNKPQPQSYYNASKAAVHHLTKSLAAEWGARGVRVNAVAPTYIDTPLNRFGMENPEMYKHWIGGTPMGRMGTIDEIGSVALFLASDAASLLTGSIVLADGGYTCW